ncbi:hypothetical protein OGAPHI_001560 [Ogataea philodendri]|uniref:IMP-specific 5'-nucleotidase 1 n=1 Tax=Ogataea philodendri TaxID=1378263 RepID=A0A9P8T8E5_9ASCO|nr:uncharacterized protein OGAPHI_001560 [Ogataea philodendri]KAH3669439.1 hypothetical protein OGAPHI_001560 [Ogataea philodendri]
MTTRYRVEYALKEHRRDGLIEWIKGLLATPFVLYAVKSNGISAVDDLMVNSEAKRRYAEIFHDLELLIDDNIEMAKSGTPEQSRLVQLVPGVGSFFTRLPLEKAFYIEDERRAISKRRLVAPSFNDIRLILNTAQLLEMSRCFHSKTSEYLKLQLITFDGDITLYDDGQNFDAKSPILPHMIQLMAKNLYVGIVTAAGYSDGSKYYERLKGLIDEVQTSPLLTDSQRDNLLIMGGEANYLFRYNHQQKQLQFYSKDQWLLENMQNWSEKDIIETLDFAQDILNELIHKLDLAAIVVRKERAVGMVPLPEVNLVREQLEEVVLRVDKRLKLYPPSKKIRWCAFNGGSDVWVDIGDKSYGVRVLQEFIRSNDKVAAMPENTLHVGDQFSSLGSNDYASRTAATTCWVSSPTETKNLLIDLNNYINDRATY